MNHSHEMEGGTPSTMAAGAAQKTSSYLFLSPMEHAHARAHTHTRRMGRRINGGTVIHVDLALVPS
uniref:Uncharacterized protein n=1 Tax=Triticum urartu TaxID=4572 RepID=A0A8R7TU80_TRIUA